jgi:hypothetical protein
MGSGASSEGASSNPKEEYAQVFEQYTKVMQQRTSVPEDAESVAKFQNHLDALNRQLEGLEKQMEGDRQTQMEALAKSVEISAGGLEPAAEPAQRGCFWNEYSLGALSHNNECLAGVKPAYRKHIQQKNATETSVLQKQPWMQQFLPPSGRIPGNVPSADLWDGTTPAYRQHLLVLQHGAQQHAALQQELANVLQAKQISSMHLMGSQVPHSGAQQHILVPLVGVQPLPSSTDYPNAGFCAQKQYQLSGENPAVIEVRSVDVNGAILEAAIVSPGQYEDSTSFVNIPGGAQFKAILAQSQQAQLPQQALAQGTLFDLATRIQFFHEQQQQMGQRHARGKEQLARLEKQRVVPCGSSTSMQQQVQQQVPTASPPVSFEMDLEGVSSSYKSHLAEKLGAKQQFEDEAMGMSKRLQTNPFYHSWNCALDIERLRGRASRRQPAMGVRASWSGGA